MGYPTRCWIIATFNGWCNAVYEIFTNAGLIIGIRAEALSYPGGKKLYSEVADGKD